MEFQLHKLLSKQLRHTLGQLETVEMETGNEKLEMENGNGRKLMQMNARVKPLSNYHFLKTPLYKDHLYTKTT